MAHSKKEDDKIEKMIRGLLKLPENRRCINCNNLGPQYVCTTFLTFICTNCSGIHREFTHRVKSISMAKFTLDEVNALLAAGNERANQIYFKTWDPQRHSKPDSRDLYKLRTFIKHVYVDRKYSGERSIENPIPSRKEDFSGNQNRYGSNTSNYGDRYDRYKGGGRSSFRAGSDERILRFCYEEGKSPGYYSLDKSSWSGAHRRSSARFEVVDDRVRDDDTRKGKRLPRLMSAEFKLGGMSVDVQNKADKANSLEFGHLTREQSSGKSLKIPGQTLQKESSSRKSPPTDVKPNAVNSQAVDNECMSTEAKVTDSRSPIISTTNVKPPDARPELIPPANDGGNWASFDSSAKETPPPKPMNTLEALLFELSTPVPIVVESEPELELALVPAPVLTPEPTSDIHSGTDQMVELKVSTESRVLPRNADSSESSSVGLDVPTQSSGIESVGVYDASLVEQTIQPTTSLVETDEQALPSIALSSNVVDTAQQVIRGDDTRNTATLPDSNTRKELPADLFAALYGLGPTPVRGWTAAPPHGYVNHMQYYPNPMPYTASPTTTRSKNPFDVAYEPTQPPQGQIFPFVAPVQGGFFNMSSPPSLGVRPFAFRPTLIPSPMAPSFSPGPYMAHEGFGNVNPNQVIRYSSPSTPYRPPVGGNPFG